MTPVRPHVAPNTAPDRILRRLSLLGYLGAHDVATFGQLADLFGVPVRTIVGDVLNLWGLNGRPGDELMDYMDFETTLPDVDDLAEVDEAVLATATVTLCDPQDMDRQIPFSTHEIVALTLGLRQLGELAADLPPQYAPVRDALASAAEKLAQAHPNTVAPIATASTGSKSATSEADGGGDAYIYSAVEDACRGGQRLLLRYLSSADVITERTVEPVEIVGEDGVWVLNAWCHRAQAPRSFRLDRILDVEVSSESVSTKHVREVRRAEDRGVLDAPEGATIEVRSTALWRVEEVPHEELEHTGAGTLRVRIPIANTSWFAGFLLRLGEDAVGVSPASAAAPAAEQARAALAAYAELDKLR